MHTVFKKCATELHLKPAPSALQKTPAKKARHRDDKTSAMLDSLGFSVKSLKVNKRISKKACSNHALTKHYLKKIILPAGGYDKETGECDNKMMISSHIPQLR